MRFLNVPITFCMEELCCVWPSCHSIAKASTSEKMNCCSISLLHTCDCTEHGPQSGNGLILISCYHENQCIHSEDKKKRTEKAFTFLHVIGACVYHYITWSVRGAGNQTSMVECMQETEHSCNTNRKLTSPTPTSPAPIMPPW